MTLHNFAQSFATANDPDVDSWLIAQYTRLFPHVVGTIKNERNNLAQHFGIDRVLLLDNGSTLRCEEKIRSNDYGDLLLEYVHRFHDGTQKPGWVEKDLLCDYFVYAVPTAQVFWAIPWTLLRAAWRANRGKWKRYHEKVADNPNFKTISCAVPLEELQRALFEQMFFRNPVQS